MSEHLRPPSQDKILATINLEAELREEGNIKSAEVIHRNLVHEIKARNRVDLDARLNSSDQD
jgi:hypothetical protein